VPASAALRVLRRRSSTPLLFAACWWNVLVYLREKARAGESDSAARLLLAAKAAPDERRRNSGVAPQDQTWMDGVAVTTARLLGSTPLQRMTLPGGFAPHAHTRTIARCSNGFKPWQHVAIT